MNKIVKFIISLLIPLSVGAIAGYFTSGSVKGWYRNVEKPSFNPPDWVFGPTWTLLYIMMGIAFFLIWKSNTNSGKKKNAIIFYFIQLFLNFCWSFIFFYAQSPGWALAEILLLWLMIILTIYSFSKISVPAAWLLFPYLCWVTFATILTYSIWQLN